MYSTLYMYIVHARMETDISSFKKKIRIIYDVETSRSIRESMNFYHFEDKEGKEEEKTFLY